MSIYVSVLSHVEHKYNTVIIFKFNRDAGLRFVAFHVRLSMIMHMRYLCVQNLTEHRYRISVED